MKPAKSLQQVLDAIRSALPDDRRWSEQLAGESLGYGIHIAIFREPFLEYILDGKKTVESRFSKKRCAPYERVYNGDLLLLKRSGGPIIGICRVSAVWFYELDPASWREIRRDYTSSLCAQDPEFWTQRKSAAFATLMRLDTVQEINPIRYSKRDRRGWVILHSDRHHAD